MPASAAKKEAKPVDLKGQIEALRADLETFLEARVAILKSSRVAAARNSRAEMRRRDQAHLRGEIAGVVLSIGSSMNVFNPPMLGLEL